jgi:hypothetical protein
MASIDNRIIQYIRPDSSTDATAEAYEYFLVWVGVDGEVYNWLFEDFVSKKQISGEVINTKTNNITKLFKNAGNFIELTAEDLTEGEVDTISDILRAKIVRRYYKDGTFDNLAIQSETFEKLKSDVRYIIRFEVQAVESNILK